MNDVMLCPGTAAAEGKSTSDLPELFRPADLSAEYNLNPGFMFGDDGLSVNQLFFPPFCSGLKHLIHLIP